jgi:hypothetical protein
MPFLKICQLCSYSRTSQHFMEPKGSFPYSQVSSTCPFPESDQSSPYHQFNCHERTCPIQISCIPRTKISCPFSLALVVYPKKPSKSENLLWYFVTSLSLRWVVSPTPNLQAGELLFLGCPWMLIQIIRSYHPYLVGISSILNLRTRHTLMTEAPINMCLFWITAANSNYP